MILNPPKARILLLGLTLLAACTSNAVSSTEHTPAAFATGQVLAQTKVAILTGEAETQTAVSPKNEATISAIIATKAAGGTEMAATMTALPTLTLTPAIPVNSRLCSPADLETSSSSNGATGNIFLGASLTNISAAPCYLQAWPQVILIDTAGLRLDVDYNYFDPNLGDASAAATAQAREFATAKVGLWPGWTAGINLIWWNYVNWCGTPVPGDVVIRYTLTGELGTIDIPTDFRPSPSCESPGLRTDVSISKLAVLLP